MSLNLNTAKTPAEIQKPFGCTVTVTVTLRGTFVMDIGDGLTGGSTSTFLGLANSRPSTAPSYSDREESRPVAGFGVGVVGVNVHVNVEHHTSDGQKRGAQEGKVAGPSPHTPPRWICGVVFPAARGSETADRGGGHRVQGRVH